MSLSKAKSDRCRLNGYLCRAVFENICLTHVLSLAALSGGRYSRKNPKRWESCRREDCPEMPHRACSLALPEIAAAADRAVANTLALPGTTDFESGRNLSAR